MQVCFYVLVCKVAVSYLGGARGLLRYVTKSICDPVGTENWSIYLRKYMCDCIHRCLDESCTLLTVNLPRITEEGLTAPVPAQEHLRKMHSHSQPFVLYSGKHSREKTVTFVGSENFVAKTFMDCLKPIIGGCGMPPNFAEKTFADSYQTSKSAKVFSLKSFPLYGMSLMQELTCVGTWYTIHVHMNMNTHTIPTNIHTYTYTQALLKQ